MRIVYIVEAFPLTTNGALVQKVVGLFQRGWDIHLICKGAIAADAWQSNAELHTAARLRQRVYENCATAVAINDQIFALDPDLIIFENARDARLSMYLKEFANSKVAVHFQGEDLGYFAADQQNYYAEIWERADAIFFESKALRQLAQSRGFQIEISHYIVPPILNLSAFPPAEIVAQKQVEEVSRPLRILSMGRLTWHYGYDYALQAVHQLLESGVSCRYRLVGSGPCEAEIRAASHQLALSDKMAMTVDDTDETRTEALAWADVLLHTAVAPCNCQPVLAAQAWQLPVIGSDAGSLPELVADAETGYVLPSRRPDLAAEKLTLLAKDPALRHRLGQAGYTYRLKQPALADYITSLEQIYQEIVA